MWKAAMTGAAALLVLGVSLASGQTGRRDADRDDAATAAGNSEQDRLRARGTPPAPGSASPDVPPRLVALVIGNGAYPDAETKLSQPIANARALAEELKAKGFDVVSGENLGKQQMQSAAETFIGKVTPGSTTLVFFSGFGIQANRKTYLIPVNAQIWIEDDVRRAGVSVEPLISELENRGAGAKLLILDASRRNPFERRFRGFAAGLAAIYAPDDTLVMYSAAPGKVVNDTDEERSPLVSELINQLRAPGLTVEEAFNRARLAVSEASRRSQVPWVSSSLMMRFFFRPPSDAPAGR